MFHNILVALDRSDMSSQVLEQAINLAKATDASLILLTVIPPFDPVRAGLDCPGINGAYFQVSEKTMQLYLEQWKTLEQEGSDWLRSQATKATEAGVKSEIAQTLGDPGCVICKLAETWKVDLIIVGRRGISELNELFLGSVSNYVLHHAPCSVLTVQQPTSPNSKAILEQNTTQAASNDPMRA
ncbi:universal stress protein [Pseudanabaenaceae cyanobacterium LEGE 13415]|nr:universal stress protein [Pseudanabaenaceae cyanobacterium LEGE 13415]